MDPITAAILAAITAGLTAGSTDVAKTALVDAYTAFKDLLKRKLGDESDVVEAVEKIESKPESAARQAT
ncbi:MAG: hypothetical protein WCF84_15830, partial [Anaerolineae bacterium]